MKKYREKFGKNPDFYAASVYDATALALMTQFGNLNSKDNIKQSLYDLKNFQGITGVISFDSNGDVTEGFQIKQIKNGKFEYKN